MYLFQVVKAAGKDQKEILHAILMIQINFAVIKIILLMAIQDLEEIPEVEELVGMTGASHVKQNTTIQILYPAGMPQLAIDVIPDLR